MRLGFYYHIPLAIKDGRMYLPGFLGVFIDALAAEVEELKLFLHHANTKEAGLADHLLERRNISWVNLGLKQPAWYRSIFHRSVLKPVASMAGAIDLLLLRSPSPLAPYFSEIDWLGDRIAYMVVSDYGRGAAFVPRTGLRNRLVRLYSQWNDRVFKERLTDQLVVVNSRELLNVLSNRTDNIHEIRTTTLSAADFFERKDTCQGSTLRLLYTGRIVMDKGLKELVAAANQLVAGDLPVEVHIVGWEDNENKPVQAELYNLAQKLAVQDVLHFHGRKTVGSELNEMYRMADIYVLPSYHEGFPRTIWEAMANSLPVIATTVGSIPDYLENGRDALLIEPRRVEAVTEAVRLLANDHLLRQKLIRGGMACARENTLDVQAKKLVAVLRDHLAIRVF